MDKTTIKLKLVPAICFHFEFSKVDFKIDAISGRALRGECLSRFCLCSEPASFAQVSILLTAHSELYCFYCQLRLERSKMGKKVAEKHSTNWIQLMQALQGSFRQIFLFIYYNQPALIHPMELQVKSPLSRSKYFFICLMLMLIKGNFSSP